jgi:mRNA interferase MazF
MYRKRGRSPASWRSCVVRGDVHQIKLPGRRGHVQQGRRCAVIVQADDLLTLSTVVICPTSRSAFPASFHPEVTLLDEPTQVLCEMVGTIDARALGEQIAHLTRDELRSVEDALLLVLDLP